MFLSGEIVQRWQYCPHLISYVKKYAVRGVAATHFSTIPIIDYENTSKYSLKKDSAAYNTAVMKYIRSNHIENVVLVAYWAGYIIDDLTGTNTGRITQIRHGLIETINALQNTGAKIWIVKEVPHLPFSNPPRALAIAVMRNQDPTKLGFTISEQQKNNHLSSPLFKGLSAKNPLITILNPADQLIDSNGFCRLEENGKSLYVDKIHLTVAGAMKLFPLFEPIFNKGINK